MFILSVLLLWQLDCKKNGPNCSTTLAMWLCISSLYEVESIFLSLLSGLGWWFDLKKNALEMTTGQCWSWPPRGFVCSKHLTLEIYWAQEFEDPKIHLYRKLFTQPFSLSSSYPTHKKSSLISFHGVWFFFFLPPPQKSLSSSLLVSDFSLLLTLGFASPISILI